MTSPGTFALALTVHHGSRLLLPRLPAFLGLYPFGLQCFPALACRDLPEFLPRYALLAYILPVTYALPSPWLLDSLFPSYLFS